MRTAAMSASAAALVLVGCSSDDTSAEADDPELAPMAEDDATRPPAETNETAENGGCGVALEAALGETTVRSVATADEERSFLLFVPGGYDPSEPTPVVLSLHGAGQGSEDHADASQLTDTADAEGFILVHPEASPRTEFNWQFDGTTEAGYIEALLSALDDELCVDPDRVFAVGGSQGGDLSTLLACQLPDRIVAVATVTVLNHHDSCTTPTPTPVLAFVGTADPIYDIDQGLALPPDVEGVAAEDVIPGPLADEAAAWAITNGCDPEPTVDPVADGITRHEFDCPDGHDLVHYVHSGGHVWPGTDPGADLVEVLGPTVLDLDANMLIWEFFETHSAASDS